MLAFALLLSLQTAPDVELVKTPAAMQQLLSNAKGKPLLVHFWATWCDSCVEELPRLAKDARGWAEQGVVLVFVSVDDPKHIDDKVRSLLHQENITFQTYLADVPDTEALMKMVDRSWNGTIPSTFVSNRRGERTGRFIGPAPEKKLNDAVVKALAR